MGTIGGRHLYAVPLFMGRRIVGLMATTCSVIYSGSRYRLLGDRSKLPRQPIVIAVLCAVAVSGEESG